MTEPAPETPTPEAETPAPEATATLPIEPATPADPPVESTPVPEPELVVTPEAEPPAPEALIEPGGGLLDAPAGTVPLPEAQPGDAVMVPATEAETPEPDVTPEPPAKKPRKPRATKTDASTGVEQNPPGDGDAPAASPPHESKLRHLAHEVEDFVRPIIHGGKPAQFGGDPYGDKPQQMRPRS